MAESDKKQKKPVFSNIYESFLRDESALKRYLRRFVYRPEDIDDMAQETFLRAYRATGSRDVEHPKAYLFRVAKSVAIRELNRKYNQITDFIEESEAEEPLAEGSVEEGIEAEQKIAFYCNAIAELPPQCRRIFLMRKYQAMSHKAIAAELNISVGAVEKQVTLGIKRCLAYVEKNERGGALARVYRAPSKEKHS